MRYTTIIVFLCFSNYLLGQCYPDRHNTTWYDSWISCEAAPNPNAVRGESHWLHYDLGHFYKLKTSKFWNANQPDFLQDGLQEVVIDYSIDGINWQEWGTHTIGQATGEKYYEGETGPDFEDITARYILVTAISNYGGDCYSLGELKIEVEETIVSTFEIEETQFLVFPNPTNDVLYVRSTQHSGLNLTAKIIDVTGKVFAIQALNANQSIEVHDLASGIYFLEIFNGEMIETVRFVKQ